MRITAFRTEMMRRNYWQQLPAFRTSTKRAPVGPDQHICLVDTSTRFQTHMGFGGAFSQAASIMLARAADPDAIVEALFGDSGLRYNMGRLCIGSSDFSPTNYHYLQPDGSVSIACEHEFVVPFVRAAAAKARQPLWLMASPWSPPPQYKTNNEQNFGGQLRDDCRADWAHYCVQYIQQMRDAGIDIAAISVQNEPAATQVWDSCTYSAASERDFVRDYLAPALQSAGLDTRIIIWDHNRDIIVQRADTVLSDPECARRVWGVGYHWYDGGCHSNLSILHHMHPNHHILFTEGCVELTTPDQRTIGDWANAETYGRNYINDANNFCEGFVDWNMLLDSDGGPNHANNFCEAPIMVNAQTGQFVRNPSYYYIGHFSRHIQPGAQRLATHHNGDPSLLVCAYANPDGTLAIIVQNTGWVTNLTLSIDAKHFLEVGLAGRSITTFLADCV